MDRPLDVALSSQFAWPSVGGTEVLVRTSAGQLTADGHRVRCFAHRIDEQLSWHGPLDRAPAFADQIDPDTGVVTAQLRLRRGEVAALTPVRVLGNLLVARVLRKLRLHGVTRAVEALHARVAGRAFARQYAGADVIHRFNGNRMALATVRAGRRLGVPVVITPLAHPGQWDDDPVSAQAYREADLVVATSEADARTYRELGVPADRVRVCALPSVAAATGGPPPRGFPSGHPVVLFLGARRAYKGADVLLEAAAILVTTVPDARVAFVGPGDPLPHAPAGNVLDVGPVDADERDRWLCHAAVVCLPSQAESFGLVLSEAWSAGVPVVTSDLPVLSERVAAAEGGLAVPANPAALADALTVLLTDEPARARMGAAGRDYYERTSAPSVYAAWHEALYAELIAERPGAGPARQAAPGRRR